MHYGYFKSTVLLKGADENGCLHLFPWNFFCTVYSDPTSPFRQLLPTGPHLPTTHLHIFSLCGTQNTYAKENKTKILKQSKKKPKIKSTKIALDSFGVGQLFLSTRTTLKCVVKITSVSTRVTMAVMEQNTTACWWLFYSSLLTLLQGSPSSAKINTWRLILS